MFKVHIFFLFLKLFVGIKNSINNPDQNTKSVQFILVFYGKEAVKDLMNFLPVKNHPRQRIIIKSSGSFISDLFLVSL